jgi:uncharacterized membrane protein YgcG
MSEEVGLLKRVCSVSLERVFVLALASSLLAACGASVQRTYSYGAPPYGRYVVVSPAPLPVVAAPLLAAPRVVVAAPPLAAQAGAAYTPVASPLLAAFDSHPRGVAPSQPDYDAYVQARAQSSYTESRPYYGYQPYYGSRPYYGYAPYYAPYYGPRYGVALPLWGAWAARGWSNHWHTGARSWHNQRGSHGGWHGHGYSRGGSHQGGSHHGGSHHGGGRHR